MLAPAEHVDRGVDARRRTEIVVAVQGGDDPGEALRTGHRIGRQLGTAYPERAVVVLLLSESANEPAPELADPRPEPAPVPLLPWSHPGQSAIEATLRAAESFEAKACALVSADGEGAPTEGARSLLAPILEDGFDLVCPCYATQRFEAVINTGIVYPVTRALFGKRLRQPVGEELAVSRRVSEHLLGEGWTADPAHAGGRLWLLGSVLSQDFRVCQAYVGVRPPRAAEVAADLPSSLARVVGLLFHEIRLHAPAWQRVKGSRPVRTYGDATPPAGEPRQPQLAPMVSAFRLGYQELGQLWATILTPQSLLAMKRLAREPEEGFGMDDALWARVVYDFALGYHLARMDRSLLLRAMTPLYLAWAAGFVREVRDVSPEQVEARIERLCHAFELAKPYLISRWRWPDRFNP